MAPPLNNFCCCCTLKTGTIIIGVLQMSASLFYLVVYGILNGWLIATVNEKEKEEDISDQKGLFNFMTAYLIFEFLLQLCFGILAVFLLIGVKKEKASFIFTWIVAMCVFEVFNVIGSIAVALSYNRYHAFTLIDIIIPIYFILVVYSHYRTIKDARNAQNARYINEPVEFNCAPPPYSPIFQETNEKLPNKVMYSDC